MNSESQSLVPATQQAESEELTVDEVRESLSTTEKGQPARLQLFRGPLPDFVAGSLCLAFLIYGGSLWEMKRQ